MKEEWADFINKIDSFSEYNIVTEFQNLIKKL